MRAPKHQEPQNFFSKEETQCKCGCGLDITERTRETLNQLRLHYGAPIHIVSGARCSDYNRRVGGARNSRHLDGLAVDIALPSNKKNRRELIRDIVWSNDFMGLGFYTTFIHVDLRREHAYWTGD
jgi:uncharacterized protein YcbK (DUF882 family)